MPTIEQTKGHKMAKHTYTVSHRPSLRVNLTAFISRHFISCLFFSFRLTGRRKHGALAARPTAMGPFYNLWKGSNMVQPCHFIMPKLGGIAGDSFRFISFPPISFHFLQFLAFPSILFHFLSFLSISFHFL